MSVCGGIAVVAMIALFAIFLLVIWQYALVWPGGWRRRIALLPVRVDGEIVWGTFFFERISPSSRSPLALCTDDPDVERVLQPPTEHEERVRRTNLRLR